ncbi:MAG: hypothetical protein GWP14_09045 [Actinobacteria bacterium]|nr:hypothetical protein [Actinomycetota bacterium]
MVDRQLDCTTLKCPMPIVKVSKAIKEMAVGQTLSVEATDAAFKADLEAWTQIMGCTIMEFTEGPIQQAVIRKDGREGGL